MILIALPTALCIYTPIDEYTEQECTNNICKMKTYLTKQKVKHNNTLTDPKTLKSLNDTNFLNLDINLDPDFPLYVRDYNYTHIDVCYKPFEKDLKARIPILIYDYTTNETILETDIKFLNKNQVGCNIYQYEPTWTIKYGFNSTTLNLSHETLWAKKRISQAAPPNMGFYIKGNFSQILNYDTILSAEVCFNISWIQGAPDNDIRIWLMKNQTWQTGLTASQAQTLFTSKMNQTDTTMSSTTLNTNSCQNITDIATENYNSNLENISVYIADPDALNTAAAIVGSPNYFGSTTHYYGTDKEYFRYIVYVSPNITIHYPNSTNTADVSANRNITINFSVLVGSTYINDTDLLTINSVLVGGNESIILNYSVIESGWNNLFEGWEGGSWAATPNWNYYESQANGRQVFGTTMQRTGSYSMDLDTSDSGVYNLNEVYTTYDFTDTTSHYLSFWHDDQGDEEQAGADHTSHQNGDGYYYTCDGSYWYLLGSLGNTAVYIQATANISADPDYCSEINSSFAIKIAQYDNYPFLSDGRNLDDINITFFENTTAVYQQFWCEGNYCYVNITVPDGFTGLQNITLNLTYDNEDHTVTNDDAVDYGGAGNKPTISNIIEVTANPDDTTEPYYTYHTIPIFNLTTDTNSNCSISDGNKSYILCPTTGGTAHQCTYPSYMEFSQGNYEAYFNCTNTVNSTTVDVNLTILLHNDVLDNIVVYMNLSEKLRSLAYNMRFRTNLDLGTDEAEPLACDHSRCYIYSKDTHKRTFAVHYDNGTVLWNISTYGDWGATVDNEQVYLTYSGVQGDTGNYGQMIVVNRTDGSEICLLNDSTLNNSIGNVILNKNQNLGYFISGYWQSSPTVTDRLVAFNLSDCTDIVWNVTIGNADADFITAMLSYSDDKLFFSMTSGTNKIKMYNATDGTLIKNISTSTPFQAFEGAWDNAIILDEGLNKAYFHTAQGITVFNYTDTDIVQDFVIGTADLSDSHTTTPAFWGDYIVNIITRTAAGQIQVWNRTDGTSIWNRTDTGYIHAQAPIISEDGTFFVLVDQPVEGIAQYNFTDGTELWRFNYNDTRQSVFSAGGGALMNGNLYAISGLEYLYAFDIGNGTGNWSTFADTYNRTSSCKDCLTENHYVTINCTNHTMTNYTCTVTNRYPDTITMFNMSIEFSATWENSTHNVVATNSNYHNYTVSLATDATTTIYIYVPVANDTCTCAGAATNWYIDMADWCNITTDCNLTTGNLSFHGSGRTLLNATLEYNLLSDLNLTNSSQYFKLEEAADLRPR